MEMTPGQRDKLWEGLGIRERARDGKEKVPKKDMGKNVREAGGRGDMY
jgi:hypothetical protein